MEKKKRKWTKLYSMLLIANVAYLIIFHLITLKYN